MVVNRLPAPASPDTGVNVGLLFASAMVPGTFARSLSARTPVDQGIATGLSVGLHYLLAVATQDTIQALAAELVRHRMSPRIADPVMRARAWTLAADLAAVPVGLALQGAVSRAPTEAMARGALRQAGWRLGATGVAGSLLIGQSGGAAGGGRPVGWPGLGGAVPGGGAGGSGGGHGAGTPPAGRAGGHRGGAGRAGSGRGAVAGGGGWGGRWAGGGRVRRARRGLPGRGAAGPGGPGWAAAVEAGRARRVAGAADGGRVEGVGPGDAQDRDRRVRRRAGDGGRRGGPLHHQHGQRQPGQPGAVGQPGPGGPPARAGLRAPGDRSIDRPAGAPDLSIAHRDGPAGQGDPGARLRQPGRGGDRARSGSTSRWPRWSGSARSTGR